ncbi:Putative ATPase with AAA domain [Leishmania donovani]|uniref:ATPase associated with various cellular activities (AAA) family protein n=1 Tax=Leishmania donovani TaxID=5661 RepID=A0A504YBW2_LEIDO|nr:ATPase associated with various cellular activities (AAA) family protein [Leishmania donovani]CAJ1992105.1 Putative ATPase with AAA domain [Leishmania donovani]VDZ47942.1 ATPase_family_associated_with_various_cellular_activities_(AAA)/AAA_domain_(dynein-related_subfamily)_putative/Pfam:PF00004/Pfam:PF07728 [Leishmania donovani]
MDSYTDLLNLNFMYSLRTGDLLTDMMIAALLPLVSSAIVYLTRTWWPQLVNRALSYLSKVDSASATFKMLENGSGLYYGHTLRVALSTYVTKVLKPRFDIAELKYLSIPGKELQDAANYTEALRDYCFVNASPAKELPMRLTEHLELRQTLTRNDDDGGRNKDAGRHGRCGSSQAPQESLFTITQYKHSFPALMKFLRLAHESTAEGSEKSEAVAQLERDANADGDAIQSLLERSLEHYRLEYKEITARTDRYLYQPLLTRRKLRFGSDGAERGHNEGAMECNRYLLHAGKTFQSLFFPAKPRLIQLIDDFEKKTGKYAIPGYPQKLVLLLYGPPGTGKTSLAKAVAAHTKRDLFAISLSRIRSDEELMKCMFSGRFKVSDKRDGDKVNYDDCSCDSELLDPAKLVYILEDVDATTAVVLKDESEEVETGGEAQKQRERREEEASTAAPPSSDSTSSDGESEEENDMAENESGEGAVVESHDAGRDATDEVSPGVLTQREVVKVKSKRQTIDRALTIDGLTNALNGVLDFPQRIVIMTTNHIERLHPSLLRPGVVTMKLHMHNFDAACAVDMVRHYFSHTTLLPGQLEELRSLLEAASAKASKVDTTASISDEVAESSALGTKGFSPAELEQHCAECDTIEELLEVLRQGSRVNIF